MRERLHLVGMAAALLSLLGVIVWWQWRPVPAETSDPPSSPDIAATVTSEPSSKAPLGGGARAVSASPKPIAEATPGTQLEALAKRTRPRVPPVSEIFRPAENWEIADADLDLESTLDLLESGRLSDEQKERYADALRTLADAGDLATQTELARLIASGIVEPEDPAEALRRALVSAEAGDPAAAMIVAQALEQGLGTEPDPQLARDWYAYAGNMGMADAWAELGFLDSLGVGAEVNHERALELYQRAFDQGSALGARRLGLAHLEGWGVEKDPALGREWLERAGEMGNGDAYLVLRLYSKSQAFGPRDRDFENRCLVAAAECGLSRAVLLQAENRIQTGGSQARKGVEDLINLARRGVGDALVSLAFAIMIDPSRKVIDQMNDTISILQMADQLNEPRAAALLAHIKAKFGDVVPDLAPTRYWLQRAADNDIGPHKFRIRLMLEGLDNGLTPQEVFTRYGKLSEDDAFVAYTQQHLDRPNGSTPSTAQDGATDPVISSVTRSVYPRALLAESVDGFVKLEFDVRKDGTVGDIEVIESTHPLFSEAAIESVAQWTFKPAMKEGEPVDTRWETEFLFRARK